MRAPPATTAPAAPPERRGVLAMAVRLPCQVLGVLMVALLCSILIECAGLLWFWPEQGWRHAQAMFEAELGWLGVQVKASLLVAQPESRLLAVLEILQDWLLVKTGFADFSRQAPELSQGNDLRAWIGQLYLAFEDMVLAIVYTTFTFVVRLMILLLATPLLLLAMLSGFVDGLVQRDLRRFGAGRESSFIYHRAKRAVLPLLAAPWVIYLALPCSLNPLFVLLPCALLLGIAVTITASTFKKYL